MELVSLLYDAGGGKEKGTEPTSKNIENSCTWTVHYIISLWSHHFLSLIPLIPHKLWFFPLFWQTCSFQTTITQKSSDGHVPSLAEKLNLSATQTYQFCSWPSPIAPLLTLTDLQFTAESYYDANVMCTIRYHQYSTQSIKLVWSYQITHYLHD